MDKPLSQEPLKCVMCHSREGTVLSTANRLYCQPCVNSLGNDDYVAQLEAERDRYKTALNMVFYQVEEATNLVEEDTYENYGEAISILQSSMRTMKKVITFKGADTNETH